MKERHIGVAKGDTALRYHLAAKGIVDRERTEESEECELIRAILPHLISWCNTFDLATGIVNTMIEVEIRFPWPLGDAKKLHPSLMPEAGIVRDMLVLDGLPQRPNTAILVLGEKLIVKIGSSPHDYTHCMALGLGPLLQFGRISGRSGVDQVSIGVLRTPDDTHVVTRGEVSLDTELPLWIVISGENRDVGVGAWDILGPITRILSR